MERLKPEKIKLLDKSNMADFLINFPGQLREAVEIGRKIDFSGDGAFDKIVFTGLGGSAIGADLIRSYVSRECRLPVFVNRDYTLPAFVDKKTLLIVSSYSGNTEETLSAYAEGKERRANIIAVTSNGELQKRAGEDGLLSITIPRGIPPRCALGFSSVPLIILFSKLGLISDKSKEIEETASLLAALRDRELSPDIGEDKNIAKRIARELRNRYAVIYGANQYFDAVVTRWRGQLAENSKALSSTHLLPEMNHNEVVGWRNPENLMKDLIVIMLRDKGDHPRVQKRMEITKAIIEKVGVKVIEVVSKGTPLLSRIFSLIYTGDFVSLYLAVLNDEDPTPVESVTYLKRELAKI